MNAIILVLLFFIQYSESISVSELVRLKKARKNLALTLKDYHRIKREKNIQEIKEWKKNAASLTETIKFFDFKEGEKIETEIINPAFKTLDEITASSDKESIKNINPKNQFDIEKNITSFEKKNPINDIQIITGHDEPLFEAPIDKSSPQEETYHNKNDVIDNQSPTIVPQTEATPNPEQQVTISHQQEQHQIINTSINKDIPDRSEETKEEIVQQTKIKTTAQEKSIQPKKATEKTKAGNPIKEKLTIQTNSPLTVETQLIPEEKTEKGLTTKSESNKETVHEVTTLLPITTFKETPKEQNIVKQIITTPVTTHQEPKKEIPLTIVRSDETNETIQPLEKTQSESQKPVIIDLEKNIIIKKIKKDQSPKRQKQISRRESKKTTQSEKATENPEPQQEQTSSIKNKTKNKKPSKSKSAITISSDATTNIPKN